ncbi:hypothetical protein [Massilia haematophila]|uniref:Uncharacterized protein n=1 Tax=Massilia haematophila TaxID=457923 RepID=A0ABV7PCU7_9BURK
MPLQNRVNPEGEICFSPERGSLMGNRGCLHDDNQRVVAKTKRDAWVTCLLKFKERQRKLMQPGQYTELFFLDEATALAAGHRPCAECRRERYKAFLAAWPALGARAGDVDVVLKRERVSGHRPSVSMLGNLPDGVMVKENVSGLFYLLNEGKARQWTFRGYLGAQDISTLSGSFVILTPASTVEGLKNGYRPEIHFSAHS